MDQRTVIENKTALQCVEIHVCWCVCSFNLGYKNNRMYYARNKQKIKLLHRNGFHNPEEL